MKKLSLVILLLISLSANTIFANTPVTEEESRNIVHRFLTMV